MGMILKKWFQIAKFYFWLELNIKMKKLLNEISKW